jgi:hypothetical protein
MIVCWSDGKTPRDRSVRRPITSPGHLNRAIELGNEVIFMTLAMYGA